VTAGRPALLRRALESLRRHCDEHRRAPRVIVVDGSRHEPDRLATKAAVAVVAASGTPGIRYVGPDEADAMRAELVAHGGPDLPLRPGGAGANRNLLLLLTAGERLLMMDDDVVCETWASEDSHEGLAVMGHHGELIRTTFAETRAAAFAAAPRAPIDLLGAHEALLGRALQDLIADSRQPVDETWACAHMRRAVAGATAHTVRVTMTGVAGDAGTYCPHRLLLASDPLRAQLCATGDTFAAAMNSREVVRSARARVLTHHPGCMTMCAGVDNERLLPPFLPRGRNEDGVFGAMLSMAAPETLFGHLPVGIFHDSPRPSARDAAARLSARETRLADLIVPLAASVSGQAGAPDAWLHEVGVVLSDLGRRPDDALAVIVEDVIRAHRTRELAHVDGLCRSRAWPAYYQAALESYRDALSAGLERPAFFLPIEFHHDGPLSIGYQALGRTLAAFGALLRAWPALWEAAATVRRSQTDPA